jgi:hypothetical protein
VVHAADGGAARLACASLKEKLAEHSLDLGDILATVIGLVFLLSLIVSLLAHARCDSKRRHDHVLRPFNIIDSAKDHMANWLGPLDAAAAYHTPLPKWHSTGNLSRLSDRSMASSVSFELVTPAIVPPISSDLSRFRVTHCAMV